MRDFEAMRTYVVTGSASGIGAATRTRLQQAGHRVIGVDLHRADVVADLGTPTGRTAMTEAVEAMTDTLDAVIACAGVFEEDPRAVAVNHFGVVATLEGLRPLLSTGDRPRAVAIASVASIQLAEVAAVDACLAGDEDEALRLTALEPWRAYFTSKQALARWIRRSAPTDRWAGAGIGLNAVAPGTVLTPMTADLLSTSEGRAMADESFPMPFGGHAEPEDIAAVADFLAGPENSRMCGQVVFVDGGADAVVRGDSTW